MVAVVALTTWFAVGRALAPVEAIRREVDAISAAQLHRRVPQPKADDEIGRLAATMNRMLERLESARNSQRRFVSDASHELRSPITTIRQHAEVALAHPDRVTAAELAEVVLAEQQRMQRLVEDLLLLARADEHVPLPRAAVDLDDLAFEEGHRLRSATSKRVDTSGVNAVRVQGDADALRRMVRNVGENAVRHASSRVDVTLVERGEEVVLTIDDDGPGIPATERARVLQRFVRLDDARSRDEGGSGLGLSIVDEVVRAHGGRCRSSSPRLAVPASSSRCLFRLLSARWRQPCDMNITRIGIVTAVGAAAVAVGTGIAAAQPDDGEGTPITGEALTKASQAALTFTGGGTVTGTEVGDEESYYEVEVTKADGSQVDVQLNDNFLVVGSKTDPPGADTEPDGDGG